MDYLKKLAKQRSTYVGVSLLLAAFGVAISPDQLQVIASGVLGVIGLVETFRDEDGSDEKKVEKAVSESPKVRAAVNRLVGK